MLKRSPRVQMLEQVALVRLIPTNLPGGDRADVEPVDIARGVQLGREILVARDRGGYLSDKAPKRGSVTTSNILAVKKTAPTVTVPSPIFTAYSEVRKKYKNCRNAANGIAGMQIRPWRVCLS